MTYEQNQHTDGKIAFFGTLIATVMRCSTAIGVLVVNNGFPREENAMKIAKQTTRDTNATELDMATIRQRVAQIKKRWSPEVAQARAAEGARRRRELDALVNQLVGELSEEYASSGPRSECDSHGLTLVG